MGRPIHSTTYLLHGRARILLSSRIWQYLFFGIMCGYQMVVKNRSQDLTILWSGADKYFGWQAQTLIACRANGPLYLSLDFLSSTWAGPVESISCRANGPSSGCFRTVTLNLKLQHVIIHLKFSLYNDGKGVRTVTLNTRSNHGPSALPASLNSLS